MSAYYPRYRITVEHPDGSVAQRCYADDNATASSLLNLHLPLLIGQEEVVVMEYSDLACCYLPLARVGRVEKEVL